MQISMIGLLAAFGSTASWALCGVLFKRLGERLDPVGMTTVKAIVAALLLSPIAFFNDSALPGGWYGAGLFGLSGLLGIAVGDCLFFAALGELSPLLLSILLFACPNLFAGVLGILCLGEMPSLLTWCGIVAVTVATGILAIPEAMSDTNGRSTMRGIVFAILSLVCTSLSMVIAKPVLSGTNPFAATMWRMAAGGIALAAFGFARGKVRKWSAVFSDLKYAGGFFFVTALAAFGGFGLSLAAVKHLDLVVASALMSLEPLFILLFMICLGRHRTCLREIAAIAIAFVGVLAIALNG